MKDKNKAIMLGMAVGVISGVMIAAIEYLIQVSFYHAAGMWVSVLLVSYGAHMLGRWLGRKYIARKRDAERVKSLENMLHMVTLKADPVMMESVGESWLVSRPKSNRVPEDVCPDGTCKHCGGKL